MVVRLRGLPSTSVEQAAVISPSLLEITCCLSLNPRRCALPRDQQQSAQGCDHQCRRFGNDGRREEKSIVGCEFVKFHCVYRLIAYQRKCDIRVAAGYARTVDDIGKR